MTDAISRSAVIKDLETRKKLFEQMPSSVSHLITDTIEMCRIIVEMMPALDAVPVVRCKDCKYAHSGNGIWYLCGTDERKRPGSFYCSAGRKKDEHDD